MSDDWIPMALALAAFLAAAGAFTLLAMASLVVVTHFALQLAGCALALLIVLAGRALAARPRLSKGPVS